MSSTAVGVLGFISMFSFMALGFPVALSMLVVGVAGVGLVLTSDASMHLLASSMWEQVSAYSLTVIPLFVMLGQVAR